MKIKSIFYSVGALIVGISIFGCGQPAVTNAPSNSSSSSAAKTETPIVLLSVTSDVNEKPQSVDMAMKLAGFSLDEGRKVAMFFNVKGVHIPTKDMSDELKFQENEPIKKQLEALIERGAEVHVCPVCMKALGVTEDDLMEGAQQTTKPKLFANIGNSTSVFTY